MATISDVAKRAGVSTVTVSRVINDVPNVNAATRSRVELAIRELGYVPSVVARSLRSKRTRSLALIVPDITNVFWTTVARGVEDAAQSHGYTVLLSNTDEDLVKQQCYLDIMASQRVDGVIIAPCNADAARLAVLRDRNIATVVIDRRIEGWDVDMVYGDSLSGAYALTRHLIGLGHTCIAMLSGPEGAPTGEDRIAGYRLALAEAGIEPDPRLIRRGGFSSPAGAQFTGQLLDEGLAPTAIFAANNSIALGVIEVLGNRRLRIPQDVALVCFDDFPNVSSFFPFLTVVAQPAYDMGANAAQLLLSRLEASAALQPRRVVLPVRLIVRHSCGSALRAGVGRQLSLPIEGLAESQISLVKPVADFGREGLPPVAGQNGGPARGAARRGPRLTFANRPDVNRLLRVLRGGEADRIPHVELRVTGRPVYEYVLERELKPEASDARPGGVTIAPEAQVEFAQRLGMDAVACELFWQPDTWADGAVKSLADVEHLESAVPLTAQFTYLERYLRAALGTGVGVFASFNSFLAPALRLVGYTAGQPIPNGERLLVERVMDKLLAQSERVIQAICDRFGADLAFVLVNDDVAVARGLALPAEVFAEICPGRMRRLITPALDHGLLAVLHTGGDLSAALPFVQEVGFGAVHWGESEYNTFLALQRAWAGRLAFMGGVSDALLRTGKRDLIEAAVRQICRAAAPGGFVLSSATGISEQILPENFIALVEAAQWYGRRAVGEPMTEGA